MGFNSGFKGLTLSSSCVNSKEEGFKYCQKSCFFGFLLCLAVLNPLVNLRVLCPACITLNIVRTSVIN